MFSENNRISERQVFRLLTYDLLGLSTLVVPSVLGKLAGRDGIFGIALGVAAALLYLKLQAAATADCVIPFPDYLEQMLGKLWGRLIQLFYLVYLFLLAGYTAYLFADVVLISLLREESFYLVLILLLALVCYGLCGGLEGRARVYEILFWFLMLPLLLMLYFALDDVQADYWSPVFVTDARGILAGGYAVYMCMSIVFLLLFVKNYMEPQAGLYKAGRRAVLLVGGVHAVLYLILTGIFGAKALGTMKYPSVTLMSAVKISGGFLKRADAFMFAVWFFTLYALLSSCIFYGGHMLMKLFEKFMPEGGEEGRLRAAAFVLVIPAGALACGFYLRQTWAEYYEWFLWYVGTPILTAIPLLLFLCRFYKKGVHGTKIRNGVGMFLLAATAGGMFSGCGTAELEDRNFPLELAVHSADNFSQEFLKAQGEGNRMLDYSHLKVVILSRAFVENQAAMQEFLELTQAQNEIPRNTYVVVAEDAKELIQLAEAKDESIGNYLEQMFENVSEVKKREYPTVGMLYQEYENRCETFFIPYVEWDVDKAVVGKYYVWKRGAAAGIVDAETAMLSFFTQNQVEDYQLALDGGEVVSLFDAHNAVGFAEEKGAKTVTVTVHCSGEVVNCSGKLTVKEQQMLENRLEGYMNELSGQVLSSQRVDVVNSFLKLGALREWYVYYEGQEEVYEQDITIRYHVDIDWVNL